MPNYSYKCNKCDTVDVEWVDSYTERKKAIRCSRCGSRSEHSIVEDHTGHAKTRDYRVESLSLGIDIEDLDKTRQEDRELGSEASEWVRDGNTMKPVFTSLAQHKRYLRDRGYVDKQSYY